MSNFKENSTAITNEGLTEEKREGNSSFYCNSSDSSDFNRNLEENVVCNSPWLFCDQNVCKCGKGTVDDIVLCHAQNNVSVLASFCITYNETEGLTEIGKCTLYPYEFQQHVYLQIPRNATELNNFMCGDQFNRAGTLCGNCKDGYYPLAFSFDMNCVQCPNGKSNWWKYALAAFLPPTILYFLILLFKLNITSSHLYGFVYYSQAVSAPGMARAIIVSVRNKPRFLLVVRSIGSLYGIWNMDFARFLNHGICLGTDTLQSLALDLLVGVYILLLVVLSYLLIKLHNRNFKPLVIIWKPCDRVFGFLWSKPR